MTMTSIGNTMVRFITLKKNGEKLKEKKVKKLQKKAREEEQWEIEHYAEGTLELVNEARAEEGLQALTLDPDLVAIAEIRAKDLCEYFSHNRPDGSEGTDLIDDYDIPSTINGENIARGTSTAINIQIWLDSSGHRKTIMGKRYQTYGAAIIRSESGATYCVQIFNRETPFND